MPLFLLALAILAAAPAHAIPSGQLYCFDLPPPTTPTTFTTPFMFKVGARNCGGKVDAVENLCLIPSMCVFADAAFKARAKAHYGTDFEKLGEADRTMAMVADQTLEKFPSFVQCAGRTKDGRGECPLLDECKEIRGADMYQSVNGAYDPAREKEGLGKIPINGGRFVPVGAPIPPANPGD